ncbi:hypothetical protein FDP41_009614 [Naegleria fowleri]|uniref:Uncharacterized protein n=1 Tax=Naegleria fowleri TaxID=5763 RepID=A0A6A5BDA8_NAEFO|nr:uncharacterized protein FDP41_009614 [Naegleria fowleri]KAF0971918.1 hypothetical protein FDP41_009614 [Naegleria fowleri]
MLIPSLEQTHRNTFLHKVQNDRADEKLAQYFVLQAKKHPSLAPVVFDVWQESVSSCVSSPGRLYELYALAKSIVETALKVGVTALIESFDTNFHAIALNHLETRTKEISNVVIAIDRYIAQGMKLVNSSSIRRRQLPQMTNQVTPSSVQTPSTSSTSIPPSSTNFVKTEPSKLPKPISGMNQTTNNVTALKSETKPTTTRLLSTPPSSSPKTETPTTIPSKIHSPPQKSNNMMSKPETSPTQTTTDKAQPPKRKKMFLKEHKNALIDWFNQNPQYATESFFGDDTLIHKFISENQKRFTVPLTAQTLKNNKESPHFKTFFQAKYLGERLVKQEPKNPAQKRLHEGGNFNFEQQKRKK